ncbi:hypothetical protein DMUE_1608 [Dictyocoela muelleri]|nr:hypothetical protein DMUE_1608 [Dictyocoela muelleri]
MKDFQIMKSQKNKKEKIIYKGYIHNFDKKTGDSISFRCIRRDCLGRIRTNNDMSEILFFNSHYHEEEKTRLVRLKNNIILKNEAKNTNNDFQATLNKILTKMKEDEKPFVGKYDSMRHYFTKLRNTNKFSKINVNNSLLEQYEYTFDGKLFLQYYNETPEKNQFYIFSTENNLQLLKRSNVWMVYETFYSSPKGLAQVYIIYSNAFDKTIPAIYVLMKSKTENVKKIVFDKIEELINIGPKMFIIDFETYVNAMSKVFPEVEIRM